MLASTRSIYGILLSMKNNNLQVYMKMPPKYWREITEHMSIRTSSFVKQIRFISVWPTRFTYTFKSKPKQLADYRDIKMNRNILANILMSEEKIPYETDM